LGENKIIYINWKHLGEDHQSNQLFANLKQLYSIVGNFKQSCSTIGYIEKLH